MPRANRYIADGLVYRHPGEWDLCGYKEILGERKRYRLVG